MTEGALRARFLLVLVGVCPPSGYTVNVYVADGEDFDTLDVLLISSIENGHRQTPSSSRQSLHFRGRTPGHARLTNGKKHHKFVI